MKLLKKAVKYTYMFSRACFLAGMFYATIGYVHTIHKDVTTDPVRVKSSEQVSRVIKKAKGDSIEERIDAVFGETIDFVNNSGNENFKDMIFNRIESDWGYIRGQHLTLEEKIFFARSISSSLDYNDVANWISQIDKNDGFLDGFTKFLKGAKEYQKIDSMDVDEMVEYDNVVCLQHSKVFAAAFNAINMMSTNPENKVVGIISFVPNSNYKHYNKLDYILPVLNSIAFGEINSSIAHAINIVASEDKVYIIEPQWKGSSIKKVDFCWETFEINKEYVNHF